MTLNEIAEYAGGSLEEVVGTYIWEPETKSGESYHVSIKIEVRRKNGQYTAFPDHQVKTPEQITPYVSMDTKDSLEAALYDCISGFKMFMKTPEETEWPPFEI
jgi:hypothetical protein